MENGLSLLKKGQKGIIHAIFSRLGLIVLLLGIQVMYLFSMFQWFKDFLPHIWGGTALFTASMVLYLLNRRDLDPTSKITWLIVIMLLPVFGALLLWYTQSDIGHTTVKNRLSQLTEQTREYIPQSQETMEALCRENPGAASLARYIRRSGCYPVFDRTAVTFFPWGNGNGRKCCGSWSRRSILSFWSISSLMRALCGGRFWRFWPGRQRPG